MMRAVTSNKWKGLRYLSGWDLPKHLISHHLTTESSKTGPTTSHPLLGPPEIYPLVTPSANNQRQVLGYSESLPRIISGTKLPTEPPPNGFIRVGHSLFPSTGNPCVDFFIYVCPNRQPCYLEHYLKMAWDHNPLTTLKIICFWRGARENGKPKRETFYRVALWLHQNHPKSLAYNLQTFARFGYVKDLLEILHRVVLEGPDDVGEEITEDVKKRLTKKKKTEGRRRKVRRIYKLSTLNMRRRYENNLTTTNSNAAGQTVEKNLNINVEKDLAINMRRKRAIVRAKKALGKYNSDPNYQFLHNSVSDIFAQLLRSDLELLKCGEIGKISLAAKWCPSLGSSYDRSTLICESIARRIFPRDSDHPEYKEIEEAHYAYRVRDRLRKQILVPIREALKIPESCKSSNTRSEIRDIIRCYRVGYVATIKYKKQYREKGGWPQLNLSVDKLREERVFQFPHNLVSLYYPKEYELDEDGVMVDGQWRDMVERLLKKGNFGSCLVACCFQCRGPLQSDIIAGLGLLVSEVAEEPWKNYIVTFNPEPELVSFHDISGPVIYPEYYYGYLAERSTLLKYGHSGFPQTAGFQKLADLILQFAIDNKLSQDKMIKRLFVLCDSYFGEVFRYNDRLFGGDGWERDYENMRNKYEEKGYILPELVFWKISGSWLYPMLSMNKIRGVTFLNGHSKILMSYFLKEGGRIKPEAMMRWAVSGEKYQDLVVLD